MKALERCDEKFAKAWWHWFFFDQKDKPERAILADPLAWYGGSPEKMGNGNFEDFRAAIHDPQTVHGMIEDYRAGLKTDRVHDEEDRNAGRKITCPVQVLWSQHDDLEFLYGDVLDMWRLGRPTCVGMDFRADITWRKKSPNCWRLNGNRSISDIANLKRIVNVITRLVGGRGRVRNIKSEVNAIERSHLYHCEMSRRAPRVRRSQS